MLRDIVGLRRDCNGEGHRVGVCADDGQARELEALRRVHGCDADPSRCAVLEVTPDHPLPERAEPLPVAVTPTAELSTPEIAD